MKMAQEASVEINSKAHSITARAMIHKKFPHIPKNNLHSNHMFGEISRDILIKEALYDMLKNIV